MTAADYRNEARSCFELARIAKTDQERQALRAEAGRLTTIAEELCRGEEMVMKAI
jgi:hypothetical protein